MEKKPFTREVIDLTRQEFGFYKEILTKSAGIKRLGLITLTILLAYYVMGTVTRWLTGAPTLLVIPMMGIHFMILFIAASFLIRLFPE